jgi:hypothetical protein
MEKPVTTVATISHVSTIAAAIREEYKLHQHHVDPALKETDWKNVQHTVHDSAHSVEMICSLLRQPCGVSV